MSRPDRDVTDTRPAADPSSTEAPCVIVKERWAPAGTTPANIVAVDVGVVTCTQHGPPTEEIVRRTGAAPVSSEAVLPDVERGCSASVTTVAPEDPVAPKAELLAPSP